MLDMTNNQVSARNRSWGDEVQYPNEPGQMTRPVPAPWTGGGPDLQHNMTVDIIGSPVSGEENYMGSLKHILMKNKGQEIVASFLVGTSAPVSWQGILYEVGNDYIVIHQPMYDRYILGDLYSLKFVEFPQENGSRHTGYRQRDGAAIW